MCLLQLPERATLSVQKGQFMIFGAHVIVYSKDAEADRAFFRDILGFKSVDAGHGWLIFALPPAEAAFHPAEENDRHELYFMCDDLKAEMLVLKKKGVTCSEVQNERWGSITKIRLPGGGQMGLYQGEASDSVGPAFELSCSVGRLDESNSRRVVSQQVCSSEQTLDFMKSG
jgi:catechol 2,3-dioxygenase-like lactoylglutathione lyase family enzyme